MTYDPAKNSADSYREAIAAKRAKLLMERIPAAKRVEVIGDCELILGDCESIIPYLPKYQAIITDPPYGINWKPRVNHQDQSWVDQINFDPKAIRFSAIDATIWGAEYLSMFLPKPKAFLSWIKRPLVGFDFSRDDRTYASTEVAWSSVGKSSFFNLVWDGGMRAGCAENRTFCHPSQKPVELMEWCVWRHKDAHTVFDPFMGSGTCAIACIKQSRRFIGIELDEGYFQIACERIRKAYAQPDLFIETAKAPEPKQESLL